MSRGVWPHPLDPERSARDRRRERLWFACVAAVALAALVAALAGWAKALWALLD